MKFNYLKNPFIPEKQVKLMLVDGRISEYMLHILSSFNIDLILTDECESLNPSISYHPDIQLHPLGNKDIVVSPNMYLNIKEKLSKYQFNIVCGNSILRSNYPEDIAYNIGRIGNFCFHNLKHTDSVLTRNLQYNGIKFVNIKQGYTKCSMAIINKTAVITSDRGIHSKALENHMDSLLISPGYIALQGKNYGFIGGCTGLIAPGLLAITGSLKMHPDYAEIKEFLTKHKVETLYLSDHMPIDLGSLIPLLEAE